MKPVIAITPSTDGVKYTLNKTYCEAVAAAGGVPVMLPYTPPRDIHAILALAQGVILSGGGDFHEKYLGEPLHPKADDIFEQRDDFEIALCKEALALDMPLLGICRGMQVLNVAAGGGILQHVEGHSHAERRGEAVHGVSVVNATLLYHIFRSGRLAVNSVHHQAVSRLGESVVEVARADDGIVEAIELPRQRFAIGVQWHPEALYPTQPEQLAPFLQLVQAASLFEAANPTYHTLEASYAIHNDDR